MTDDTTVVARFASRHEGEAARGFLEDAGIPAALFADDAGGMEPQLVFVRPARLVVPSAYADRARKILVRAGVEPDEEGR